MLLTVCESHDNRHIEGRPFIMGINAIAFTRVYTCAVKLCDIMKAQNKPVISVYRTVDHFKWSLCHL